MNIPHLLSVGYPDMAYLCHDRTYAGLEWLDKRIGKPTLQDLEAIHLRLLSQAREHAERMEHEASRNIKNPHEMHRDAVKDAAPIVLAIKEENEKKVALLREEIIQMAKESAAERLKEEAFRCWEEVERQTKEKNIEALKYLNETDWYVTRLHESGEEIPREVLDNRVHARESILHGRIVYAHWDKLRSQAYPSKAEMAEAFRKGSMEAVIMLKKVKDINDKFRRPGLK